MKSADLPTFGHCSRKLHHGDELTALERLIHDNEPVVRADEFREQVAAAISEASPTLTPEISDFDLRALWRRHGGEFHGPNVETGTMPESLLLPFLRALRK